jgi:hypothetical protein
VDAAKMRELTHCYAEYRQAITTPTDPVRTLSLTGKVVAAARQVITDACLQDELRQGDETCE